MTQPVRRPRKQAPARAQTAVTPVNGASNGLVPELRLNGHRPAAADNRAGIDPSRNGQVTANGTPARRKPASAKALAVAAVPVMPVPTVFAPVKVGPVKAPRKAAPRKAAPRKAAPGTVVPAMPVSTTDVPARITPAKLRPVSAANGQRQPDVWDERVASVLGFLRRRLTGQYDVDEFGFDPELTETLVYPVLRLIKERYFRIETSGVENLPRDTSALLVANHSGTLPVDALMLSIAVHDETPLRRYLRLLGADLVFRIPVLSEIARKAGSTLACAPDAERMLRGGEYVGVFPEGFKGIGKPYRDRYKLQRFGRGGFVAAALRTGTPIVPVSIVGAEEIYPIIGNIRPLARMTGLPYVPVTPLFPLLGPLGMLPLPSKWLIEFGEPIETASMADEADDPIVVFDLADQVRETIQQTLYTLLERRPDPFG